MIYLDLRNSEWRVSVNTNGTGGCFLKTIYNFKGIKQYIKLSNYDTVNGIIGHESINEVIAYRLAKKLGLNCAEQRLIRCKINLDGDVMDTYACMSPSYLKEGEKRESFENFYDNRKNKGEDTISFIRRNKMESYIYRMFVYDYIIYNRDRHGANIELLKNKDGIYRFAPLFDNGMSFVFSCHEDHSVEKFDALVDRPVNNYIGYKSVLKNLDYVTGSVMLKPLNVSDRASLFYETSNILSKRHRDKMWKMIGLRYNICVEKGVIK